MSERCEPIIFARHAILAKGGHLGQIALACSEKTNLVSMADPRRNIRNSKTFATREEAEHWFDEYVIASVTDNGWRLIYNGARNQG